MQHEHLRRRHHTCYVHNLYCAHGIYCCARSILFKVTHSKGLRPLPPTPKKQIALEFKFTAKLKLEFDFDFDLISGSNFNNMGVKIVQISTYHFQI